MPTSTTTSLISAPRHWVTRSISNDNLIASIDRVIDRLAECQLLVDLVLDQSRVSDEVPALQGHHATNAEHPAHARHPRWQDEDLVIIATPEGRTVQHRPLPAPTENMSRPYSFGLVGADLIYRDALHHLLADHTKGIYVNDLYKIDLPVADQPTPTVNMV